MTKKTLQELLDATDPIWPHIQDWILQSSNHIVYYVSDKSKAESELEHYQVSLRAAFGAVIWETSGMLILNKWIKMLGSDGNNEIPSIKKWNDAYVKDYGIIVVGYDILGGFFALNAGKFQDHPGNVFYFAPDTLEWEDLEMGYTQFLNWLCMGNIVDFYQPYLWDGCFDESIQSDVTKGFHFYPPLWTKSDSRSRRLVPQTELWAMQQHIRKNIM